MLIIYSITMATYTIWTTTAMLLSASYYFGWKSFLSYKATLLGLQYRASNGIRNGKRRGNGVWILRCKVYGPSTGFLSNEKDIIENANLHKHL